MLDEQETQVEPQAADQTSTEPTTEQVEQTVAPEETVVSEEETKSAE